MATFTFRTKLAECRKGFAEESDDGWREFKLKILDKWHAHGHVETGWLAIEKAVLDRASRDDRYRITAAELLSAYPYILIDWVVVHAIAYKRLVDELIPGSEAAENRELQAAEIQRRDAKRTKNPDLLRVASERTIRAWEHREKRMRILGRTRKPNPKRAFALDCRQMLLDTCGKKLNNVVEMLTEIVSGKKDLNTHVMLKPTTKAKRAKMDIRGTK